MRLINLIAPIGYGQRSVITCRPGSDKRRLLTEMASSIASADPEAKVCILLVDEAPESVTELRESLPGCQVWAALCDMPPEHQLRVCDLAIERVMRLVETGADVILFVDSLSRLCRTVPATAVQAGRAAAGSVPPSSLYKARRIFGSARALREGGSLTVFGILNSDPANRADDVLSEEFRGVANHEICLEPNGSWPCFDTDKCANLRRVELITNERQQNAIRSVHDGLRGHPEAIPYIMEELKEAGSSDGWIERHL